MSSCVLRWSTAILFCFASHSALSATTNSVTIGDFFFTPNVLTVTNGDTVQWRNSGPSQHDSTQTTNRWASGLLGLNGTFSFKFTAAGFYPYRCQFHQVTHPQQTGSVTVVTGPNVLPIVAITNPVNNATFTAPASFTIGASASDSDGTISQLQFFNGANSLGIDNSSPYSANVSSLGAGSYTLSAVATDNSGGKATNSITVTVKDPPNPVTILNPAIVGDLFSFSFLSQSGYTYTVKYRLAVDAGVQSLMTTNGTGGSIVITDPKTDPQRFYEVFAQ